MFGSSLLTAFGLLILPVLSYTQEQLVDPDISIGVRQPISKDGSTIDGFQTIGVSQVLRDRVILTPIYPGSQRAAIWSTKVNHYNEWTADLEFRANGEERAGGSFHFWYAAGGAAAHGTDSVYTAKRWDGMAILIDKYGNHGGSLRGFLNDGKTDFSIHHNVHSLSFAHCDFSYRNLGTPSKITIEHTLHGLKVLIDGRTCFETKEVRLPTGYHFGITAASADQPDSFELFHVKISSPERMKQHDKTQHQQIINDPKARQYEASYKHGAGSQVVDHPDQPHGKAPHEVDFKQFKDMPDAEATTFKTTDLQFKDLHDRIQALTHHLAHVQAQIESVYDKVEASNHRLEDYKSEARSNRIPREQMDRMEQKLNAVENMLRELDKTFHSKDYSNHFDAIHHALREQHSSLLYAVPDSVAHAIHATTGSRLKSLIVVLLVVQIGYVAGYIWYKRRRAQSPKKFL